MATPAAATIPAAKAPGKASAGAPAVCGIDDVSAGVALEDGLMVGTVAIDVLDDAQWTELDEGTALLLLTLMLLLLLLAGAVGATGVVDETGEDVGDWAAA